MLSYSRTLPALLGLAALVACNEGTPVNDSPADGVADVNSDPDVADDFGSDLSGDPADDAATDAIDEPDLDSDAGEADAEPDRDAADADTEVDASDTLPGSDTEPGVYEGPIAPIGIDLCALSFGDSLGVGAEESVFIANRSDTTFWIAQILVPPEAAPAFEFDTSELPIEVPPETGRSIHFRYSPGYPDAPDAVDYEIVLEQGDDERTVTCSLSRVALPDICKTINIEMSVADDPLGRSGRALGWARPLDTILLEAVPDNPSETLAEIVWRVENSPTFANLDLAERDEFPGSPVHRQYTVFAPGPHRICADTISERDEFCTQCAEIFSELGDGLWIELTWPFVDTGADLQLHAVPVNSSWFDEDTDSWSESVSANWTGEIGGFFGLASSAGPAFTHLIGDCRWYAVGVFNNGEAPASPAFQLYHDGDRGELLGGPELLPGEFWDIGRVHLPSFTFDPTNLHITDFEVGLDSPGPTPLMARVDLCTETD